MAVNNSLDLGNVPLATTLGGNGVSNPGKWTNDADVEFQGAFTSNFTLTGTTNVTFPTSGTLATVNDIGSVVIVADIIVTSAALASGGEVTLLAASTGTEQWQFISMFTSVSGSIIFAGAGSNRRLLITDNVSEFGTIPAASTSLVAVDSFLMGNGSESYKIYMPVVNSFVVPTAAGADIVAKYQGGTTDYTSGQVSISLVLRKYAD